MKKTKIKQRFANAADAFFAEEDSGESNLESFGTETNFWREENYSNSSPKNGSLETFFKQAFLFFPGTFVLYILSLGFTVAFISNFIRPMGMTLRFDLIWVLLIFLASILMTWLGLGDVRKLKHFVIPASVISVGAVVGAVVAILITTPFYGRLFFRDSFPFYLFPLALIVPFLAKGWVDSRSKS